MVELREKLINISGWNTSKFKSKNLNLFYKTKKYIILPREFGIKFLGLPKKILLKSGLQLSKKYDISNVIPRDYQKIAVKKVYEKFKNGSMGGTLIMPPASGKTITSILISIKINLKTLIIVNTRSLAEQWKNELNSVFGINNVLILKKNDKNIDKYDFIICVINSIYKGKFSWDFFKNIGLTIIDEVHSIVSEKQLKIFNYISRRFILGVTATLERLDGLDFIIEYYIGKPIYVINLTYKGAKPIIYMVDYKPKLKNIILREDGKFDYVKTYMKISFEIEKINLIKKLIEIFSKNCNRMIVIFPYKKMIDIVYNKIMMTSYKNDIGVYYSVSKKDDIKKQKETLKDKKIILAIYSLARQSLNIFDCNCLILISTIFMKKDKDNNYNTLIIKQCIGRVLRKEHKDNPKIVIINDIFSVFVRHTQLRKKYFNENGWKMISFNP
jgi:superfamily II DNA or RNA helicase